jgi:Flp pilus assembly protein TadG
MFHIRTRRGRRGQALVIFAGGLIAIVVGVGLIIDVGFAWAESRNTQNGADAAARAGALVLAQAQADPATGKTSLDVWNAISATAAQNDVAVDSAFYTDWLGNDFDGGTNADPDGTTPGWGTPVSTGGAIPPNAAGVLVNAEKEVRTYLISVIGINSWSVGQPATAVAGPTTGCVDTVDGCNLLPITFPVTVFACTNNGRTQPIDPPQTWSVGQEITLPICGGNPGSVGWLDWTPPAGGSSELADVIANPPDDLEIPLPSWQYVTQTGDISAKPVEDALNDYAGEIVLIPFFDSTCNETPTNQELSGCPAGAVGGAGQNQWYHITKFLSLQLAEPKGAFVNGNNTAECGVTNAKECIKGAFVTFITEGTVGPPCPVGGCEEGTSFSVQLIR